LLSSAAGVLREGKSLRATVTALYPLAMSQHGAASDPAIVGLMIAVAALQRNESRGAHSRVDFPEHAEIAVHSKLRLGDALAAAQDLVPDLVI
jgi:L-aspartate oxidase